MYNVLAAIVAVVIAFLFGTYKERKKNKNNSVVYDKQVVDNIRRMVDGLSRKDKLKKLQDND